VLQVYCRDAGRREAQLGFALFRDGDRKPAATSNLVPYVIDSAPAVLVRLKVQDHDGKPVMAAFTFRDAQGRVHPSVSRRLAPDFGFHPQVYRKDGETVSLQPGAYSVTWTRGPEYLVETRKITVPAAATHTEAFRLTRWIFPRAKGWYSGDHHIHAAGCAHYESPTEGVAPEDMMDFSVNGLGVGLKGSEVRLKEAGKVQVKVYAAALLEAKPTPATEAIRKAPWNARPYWDLERCRVGDSRRVLVEVVVNGKPVATTQIDADGKPCEVTVDVPIKASSWVAVRILGSSHTNPVFVLVDGKPIRANKKSAEWCLAAVEQCWKQKWPQIRRAERAEAQAAYDHACKEYRRLIAENPAD
jgi:hypothetical protein